MINGKTVLGVILARGGSKRVQRKNLREYSGKPLIQWAIEEGEKSAYIDTLVVSTDDLEISTLACDLDCIVIPRPSELATDTATSEDALRHVLSKAQHDLIVLLQPTSPKRLAEDIDACIETAQMGNGCISTLKGEPNGAVYVVTADWIADHNFSDPGLFKYAMPADRSLDINEPEDFLK